MDNTKTSESVANKVAKDNVVKDNVVKDNVVKDNVVKDNVVKDNVVEVKFVTIAGKEVEVKYEMRRRKYDIFGLHTRERDRRNGSNNNNNMNTYNNNNYNRKTGNSDSKARPDNYDKNIGHRNVGTGRKSLSNDKHNDKSMNASTDSTDSITNSNNSVDSKESLTDGSTVSSTAKVAKAYRRLESSDGLLKKSDLSVERIVNRMAKEKEPVQMQNRFGSLLSSSTGEELALLNESNADSSDKSSAKKNKKKKRSKIGDNSLVFISNSNPLVDHNYSENNGINSENNNCANIGAKQEYQEFIAQNSSVLSSSVVSVLESLSADQSYETNNNYNNSEENQKKVNNKLQDIENKPILKLYKNVIHETNDRLLTTISDKEVEVSQPLGDSQSQTNLMESQLSSNEKESDFSAKTDHSFAPSVRQRQSKSWNKYSNGGLILEEKSSVDKKYRSKTRNFGQQVSKELEESSVDQNNYRSIMKWLAIFALFVALLVLYTIFILNQFCKCG